jgi:hypothetical protein
MGNRLADALAAQDNVAIALALRSDGVLVPMIASPEGDDQVRVFRPEDSDKYMLLLFSSDEAYKAMLVEQADAEDRISKLYQAPELLDFIKQNEGVLEVVWFDIAGPDATQASPADLIEALELPGA